MNALKFGLYVGAMVVFPAVFCGAVTFAILDHLARRRDWQKQWDNLVNEAETWLGAATVEEA